MKVIEKDPKDLKVGDILIQVTAVSIGPGTDGVYHFLPLEHCCELHVMGKILSEPHFAGIWKMELEEVEWPQRDKTNPLGGIRGLFMEGEKAYVLEL